MSALSDFENIFAGLDKLENLAKKETLDAQVLRVDRARIAVHCRNALTRTKSPTVVIDRELLELIISVAERDAAR